VPLSSKVRIAWRSAISRFATSAWFAAVGFLPFRASGLTAELIGIASICFAPFAVCEARLLRQAAAAV
jgi:hypothetical protein